MPDIRYMRDHTPPIVVVVSDDGQERSWPLEQFEADPVGCVAATGAVLVAVPQEVTETQFIRAVVRLGIITAAEGKAYLGRGELPAMMQAALDQLPEPQRTDAMLKAIGSSSFSRGDEVFAALVASGTFTDAQVDDVFRLAGSLD